MDYEKLADVYEKLEKIPSKLGKRDILAGLIKKTPERELDKIVFLITGRVFPIQAKEDLGIASKMMLKAIAKATGFSEKKIVEEFRESGDLGLVAEKLVKSKSQRTLMKKKLTVDIVFNNLRSADIFSSIHILFNNSTIWFELTS